ncbi:MAG: hypothetical protein JW910_11340, partial [Anaerolineae bacterium]|nr:hypothetical protein [Anaerolineae bacterium]
MMPTCPSAPIWFAGPGWLSPNRARKHCPAGSNIPAGLAAHVLVGERQQRQVPRAFDLASEH